MRSAASEDELQKVKPGSWLMDPTYSYQAHMEIDPN